jgi:peptidyl-prolyl cis-trans isomerase D
MLDAMRKSATGWIAKIFIALLVVSFAVWGVADIFGGYGSRKVASVGDIEISTEEFQEAYRLEVSALSARIGNQITLEQARAMHLDTIVMGRLVSTASLDAQARELNLGISENALLKEIERSRMFHGSDGRFDPQIFQQILRNNGLSEGRYVARLRNDLVRRQITGTVDNLVRAPEVYINALHRFRNEQRILQYFTLPPTSVDTVENPTERVLQEHYEQNKHNYTAPEYRKLSILELTPEMLKKSQEISDIQIKDAYEANMKRFQTPERRNIQQISFGSLEEAQAARKKIKSATDFLQVARERNFSDKDISLENMSLDEMVDQAIGKAAFALKKGEISQPVEGMLATVILKVDEVMPGTSKPLSEVSAQIRDELAQERAVNEVIDMMDAIEDERAAGATFVEIAKKFGLKHHETDAVDAEGNGMDKKQIIPIADVPGALFADAFKSDTGVENDVVETSSGGFLWYEVLDVILERQKPVEEVRQQLVEDWKAVELRSRLGKKANELLAEIRAGKLLATIAKSYGAEQKTSGPLKRDAQGDGIPATAVGQAFMLAKGDAGSAPSADGKSRLIFKLEQIIKPEPPNKEQEEELGNILANQMSEDMAEQYIRNLQNNYGVQVNNAAVQNTLTGINMY